MAYKEHGQHLLERFIEQLEEYAKLEQNIKSEGRTMHAIVSPLKSKKKKK
jgi:translation initiation factor IF-3